MLVSASDAVDQAKLALNEKVPLSRALRDFIASFRNLCVDPPVEMRIMLNEVEQLKPLLATRWQGLSELLH